MGCQRQDNWDAHQSGLQNSPTRETRENRIGLIHVRVIQF